MGSIKPIELTGYRPARLVVVAVGIPLNLTTILSTTPNNVLLLQWHSSSSTITTNKSTVPRYSCIHTMVCYVKSYHKWLTYAPIKTDTEKNYTTITIRSDKHISCFDTIVPCRAKSDKTVQLQCILQQSFTSQHISLLNFTIFTTKYCANVAHNKNVADIILNIRTNQMFDVIQSLTSKESWLEFHVQLSQLFHLHRQRRHLCAQFPKITQTRNTNCNRKKTRSTLNQNWNILNNHDAGIIYPLDRSTSAFRQYCSLAIPRVRPVARLNVQFPLICLGCKTAFLLGSPELLD